MELFGYSTDDFVSGRVLYAKVVHPDDLERVAGEVANFSIGKERKRFTHEPYRIVTKDGKIKWLADRTYIRRDEKGKITHYQGIVLDITERKRAEETLMQERNKLQDALAKGKMLSGLLPICASCKKIRDDKGYWNQIESYIRKHSEAEFSHSLCLECAKRLYPFLEIYKDKSQVQ